MGLKYHINHIIATTYLPNHQRTLVVVWFYGTQASVYIKDEQDKKLYNLQVVFYVTIAQKYLQIFGRFELIKS